MPYYNAFTRKLNQTSLKELSLLLVGVTWLCGAILSLAAFSHWFTPMISLCLLLPVGVLISIGVKSISSILKASKDIKVMALVCFLIWLSHLIQVWVPETGFDALWYHLPVAQLIVQHHGLAYESALYQSVNPLWSDLFFVAGFQVLGLWGAKLVAYLFGLSFVVVVWQLSRIVLNRKWSYAVVLIVSTFQVVSWQSASFYIDLANAFWLLAAAWLLILHFQHDHDDHHLVRSAALFGASLASKLFSVLLLPVVGTMVWCHSKPTQRWKKLLVYETVSLIVALPYYVFAYFKTGNPWFAIQLHLEKLNQIGGQANSITYIVQRMIQLPWSLFQISLVRDYVWVFFPFLWLALFHLRKKVWKTTETRIILLFSLGEWLIWWFVPPLSTRYALAGFVGLVIVGLWSVKELLKTQPRTVQKIWWGLVMGSIVLQMLPRLYVNVRSLKYVLGFQTQTEYLQQFYDGWTDPYLDRWYNN